MEPANLGPEIRAGSPHLLIGAGGCALLALVCLCGPVILPRPPGGDPVRAALLPPTSTVIACLLHDGTVVMAAVRDVTVGVDSVSLGRDRLQVVIPTAKIAARSRHTFWLGSDRFGRDCLRQVLLGGRLSLLIAGLAAILALLVGGSVGLAAATAPRLVDTLLMRGVDAILAFPVLILMILVSALLRPGPTLLVVLLGLTSWMSLARLVRGQVLSLRTRPFVLAARSAGSRWYRIWTLHYLPNIAGPVGQDTALRLGDLVIAEATLSYLGLGVPPTVPTWGGLVRQGHLVLLDAWWLATFPGLAIVVLVISLALLGDGVQELLESDGRMAPSFRQSSAD